MPNINDRVKQFLDGVAADPMEERVVEYVVREVHQGRRLTEVIEDPYVRNRLNETKRSEVLENPEVIDALEQEIRTSMSSPPELGFPG